MMSFITDYLVPKNLSLEFKNRIENLCSLSGSPMSPALREWVINKFGLEMVRVIEGYSSLTPPVFSPQLQEKINRVVPTNYQGENVNMMFKQLFNVSCPTFCLYSTVPIYDVSYGSFTDPLWDWGGFGTDFSAYANSIGGYYIQDGYFSTGSTDSTNALHFCYIGTSAPPDLIFYNPNTSDYVRSNFIPMCNYGCISTSSTLFSSIYSYEWFSGFNFFANCNANYGGVLDFTAGAAGVQYILQNMLNKYQPQASVFVTDDGGGYFTITFQDFYYDTPSNGITLYYNSGFNSQYITTSTC